MQSLAILCFQGSSKLAVERVVEVDYLATSLVVEFPDVSFAGAVSQYVAYAACYLAFVVARLELVALYWFLRDVGEAARRRMKAS